ncbi:peptide/nickel transport system substrate-binding protein [Vibrio xiamenensis]|uniref:Peptide/nickel transport system substrate-binding protein n=1 Tax=Vibrio xiamenensis TaxID=861298 RepID=A0A1G8DM11_9VIBR|nr:ABC transporter substrate-binding protein [Vibrio xiamenensis]SDH58519.1 peptide/nickel transport system substrate-binding protein [Vibrio xiamenensis]
MQFFITFLLMISAAFPALAETEPTKTNTLLLSGSLEFTNIDPSSNGYIFTRMQVIETLFDVDEKGTILPSLATGYQVSDDLKTWTIQLRSGVKFHDGSTLDAQAAAYSLNVALNKYGSLGKAHVESIKAQGSNTLIITLNQPFVSLPAVLANYANAILSRHSYGTDDKVVNLYGSGPYTVYELAPPHKLTVQRFGDYWGKKASIEFATYLTGHRAESRVLQASSGQADIALELPPASLMRLKMNPQLALHSVSLPRTLILKLNNGHPFLDDVNARKALSLAIDRKGLARAVLRTPGSESDQLLPKSMGNWHLDSHQAPEYNLEKAQQLLKQLGWTRNSDGMLEKQGQPFYLTLITYADRPELTNIATALQAQWKKLGVNLRVDITNSSAIPAGHQDGSLDVALIARNYGVIPDPLAVLSSDFGPQGGDWGAMNWSNPELNELFAQLSQTTDANAYREKAQRAAKIIADELPIIAISSYTNQVAVNKRVKGFRFDPFGRSYYLNEMEF